MVAYAEWGWHTASAMCNLYSITTNQAAIIAPFRVINRYVGNLPPMLGVFPDYRHRDGDDALGHATAAAHGRAASHQHPQHVIPAPCLPELHALPLIS